MVLNVYMKWEYDVSFINYLYTKVYIQNFGFTVLKCIFSCSRGFSFPAHSPRHAKNMLGSGVSGWNHLKASASRKTHNSDFKHKCSKDIKGISSEMKIRPWAFPKRKNSFKYDGSASVEERYMWATLQEKNISVKLATTWALLDDGNVMHRNRKTPTWLCN